jgi:hypothetical protein
MLFHCMLEMKEFRSEYSFSTGIRMNALRLHTLTDNLGKPTLLSFLIQMFIHYILYICHTRYDTREY